jgi:hypothetical protein
MSENPSTTPSESLSESAPTSPSVKTPTAAEAVTAEVASLLGSSAEAVKAELVSYYVDAEKKRRLQLLVKAFEKKKQLAEAVAQTKRPKPNTTTYTADGAEVVVPATYTKDELETRKKAIADAEKKQADFEQLLTAALVFADAKAYDKLAKQLG